MSNFTDTVPSRRDFLGRLPAGLLFASLGSLASAQARAAVNCSAGVMPTRPLDTTPGCDPCTGTRSLRHTYWPRLVTAPHPAATFPREEWDLEGQIKFPVPGTGDRPTRTIPTTDTGYKQLYRMYNTMCFILDGIHYDLLYDDRQAVPVRQLLRNEPPGFGIIAKLERALELYNTDYVTPAVRREISEYLTCLVGKLDALTEAQGRDVTLRTVYLGNDGNEGVQLVVTNLLKVYALAHNDLCFPFCFFTQTEECIDDFLSSYGSYDLLQLFAMPKDGTLQSNGSPWPTDKAPNCKRSFLMVPSFEVELAEDGLVSFQTQQVRDWLLMLEENKCSPTNGQMCNTLPNPDNCAIQSTKCFCTVAETGGCSIISCCEP